MRSEIFRHGFRFKYQLVHDRSDVVDPIKKFEHEREQRINEYPGNDRLIETAQQIQKESIRSL